MLEEAVWRLLNLRKTLARHPGLVQCRRGGESLAAAVSMAMKNDHFPFLHKLEVFEFEAQPSGLLKSVIKLWRQVGVVTPPSASIPLMS